MTERGFARSIFGSFHFYGILFLSFFIRERGGERKRERAHKKAEGQRKWEKHR